MKENKTSDWTATNIITHFSSASVVLNEKEKEEEAFFFFRKLLSTKFLLENFYEALLS